MTELKKEIQKLAKPVDRNIFLVLHDAIMRDYYNGHRNFDNTAKELGALASIRNLLEV